MQKNKTTEDFTIETKPNKSIPVKCFSKEALKKHDENLIFQERKQWEGELKAEIVAMRLFYGADLYHPLAGSKILNALESFLESGTRKSAEKKKLKYKK